MSGESLDEHRSMLIMDDEEDGAVIETASMARIVNDRTVHDSPVKSEAEPPS